MLQKGNLASHLENNENCYNNAFLSTYWYLSEDILKFSKELYESIQMDKPLGFLMPKF